MTESFKKNTALLMKAPLETFRHPKVISLVVKYLSISNEGSLRPSASPPREVNAIRSASKIDVSCILVDVWSRCRAAGTIAMCVLYE